MGWLKTHLITVRNEVAKVMFLQACVCPQGGCLLRGGAPRGCLLQGDVCSRGVSTLGGVRSRTVSAPGGCLLPGGCLPPLGVCSGGSAPGGVCSAFPRERRLLLLRVRILLECILVENIITSHSKRNFPDEWFILETSCKR